MNGPLGAALTYATFGRGGEEFLGTYRILDVMPTGRGENGPYHSLLIGCGREICMAKAERLKGTGGTTRPAVTVRSANDRKFENTHMAVEVHMRMLDGAWTVTTEEVGPVPIRTPGPREALEVGLVR